MRHRKSANVQMYIPIPVVPKCFTDKEVVEKLLVDLVERQRRGEIRGFRVAVPQNKLPKKLAFAWVFIGWHADLEEIVDNLNLVISDLYRLSSNRRHTAKWLWARYRLLVRTFLYEFYRIKDVLAQFLKKMEKLGATNKKDRKKTIDLVTSTLLKPMIDTRNQITHNQMRVIEEEYRAYSTVLAEAAGRVLADMKTGRRVKPHEDIGERAVEIAKELTKPAKLVIKLLQDFTDEIAKDLILDNFLEGQHH